MGNNPSKKGGAHGGKGKGKGGVAAPEQKGVSYTEISDRMTVEDFELMKVVGKGSFGKVMMVKKKDNGKIYAMKVLKKDQLVKRRQVAHTQTERKVLQNIDHPFIVSLRYAFQTDAKLYMILDYFTGGELFFHLKSHGKFDEYRAKYYAAEIISAIACLHRNNIVYRDLKPENVLLDNEGHIRLTDFGLSKDDVSSSELTHTFCGTPEYLAPEVVRGAAYGQAVDWWSLGTLLYEMLTGLPPFYHQNLQIMYEKIIRGKLTFPSYLKPSAVDLLSKLLERNPKNRLGTGKETDDGFNQIKSHPFFEDIDWDKLDARELPPPFTPENVEGETDTTNVDEEFKSEKVADTPANQPTNLTKAAFPGFTYKADSALE